MDKPSVFVLMPFEDTFEAVYTDLIKAPLEDLGFVVGRADSLFNQQQILKDVVHGIADADLIVADVTGLNGNVLYELGLAHAMGKRAVMITQQIEELPFDLRPYRANEYSTLFSTAHELKDLLSDIGKAVLSGEADFSNPVQDFAPHALGAAARLSGAVGKGGSGGGTMVVPTGGKAGGKGAAGVDGSDGGGGPPDDADDDEPGFLEYAAAIESGSGQVQEITAKLTGLTEDIATRFESHTERMERAQSRLGQRAAGAQLAIARDVAKDLDGFTSKVQPLTKDLRAALGGVANGANAIAHHGTIDDAEDVEAVRELLESLRGAEEGMREGREGVLSFAEVMLDMPPADRVLGKAAKRAGNAVLETAEVVEAAESEFARARGLLEERLDRYLADT